MPLPLPLVLVSCCTSHSSPPCESLPTLPSVTVHLTPVLFKISLFFPLNRVKVFGWDLLHITGFSFIWISPSELFCFFWNKDQLWPGRLRFLVSVYFISKVYCHIFFWARWVQNEMIKRKWTFMLYTWTGCIMFLCADLQEQIHTQPKTLRVFAQTDQWHHVFMCWLIGTDLNSNWSVTCFHALTPRNRSTLKLTSDMFSCSDS